MKAGETFRDNIPGPLSFFSTLSGTSQVTVEGKKTSIKEDFFFLSNAGQRYTLEIEKKKPCETFNIHFGENWAEEIFSSFTQKTETFLDQPNQIENSNIHFYNKLFVKDDFIISFSNNFYP